MPEKAHKLCMSALDMGGPHPSPESSTKSNGGTVIAFTGDKADDIRGMLSSYPDFLGKLPLLVRALLTRTLPGREEKAAVSEEKAAASEEKAAASNSVEEPVAETMPDTVTEEISETDVRVLEILSNLAVKLPRHRIRRGGASWYGVDINPPTSTGELTEDDDMSQVTH